MTKSGTGKQFIKDFDKINSRKIAAELDGIHDACKW